jgi:hypothetical protein
LDTRINKLVQRCTDFLGSVLKDLGNLVPTEDFNKYCVVVDLDGNGWSDRFGSLLNHYATPILRMKSNHTAFFEGLYEAGETFEQFQDLDELLEKARSGIRDCQEGGAASKGQAMAQRMQAATAAHMDHVSIAAAFAYGLVAYRNISSWAVDYSLENFREVGTACCSYTNMPRAFAAAVSSRRSGAGP